MKVCDDFQELMVDSIEDGLTPAEQEKLFRHLKDCVDCGKEYERLKRLHGVMDSDEIELPSKDFFEGVKVRARQRMIYPKRFPLKKIAKILIPAFAVAAVFVVIIRPTNNDVELSIPVSILIEDEDVAYVAMQGIVTKDVAKELISIEDHLSFDAEEAIEQLTVDEKRELIDVLNQKYAIGT